MRWAGVSEIFDFAIYGRSAIFRYFERGRRLREARRSKHRSPEGEEHSEPRESRERSECDVVGACSDGTGAAWGFRRQPLSR